MDVPLEAENARWARADEVQYVISSWGEYVRYAFCVFKIESGLR